MALITIFTKDSNFGIPSQNIISCQILHEHSIISLLNNDIIKTTKPTCHLESELLSDGFFAISANLFVNPTHIDKIILNTQPCVVLKNNCQYTINSELANNLFRFLENM